jgi:hypothetical protein
VLSAPRIIAIAPLKRGHNLLGFLTVGNVFTAYLERVQPPLGTQIAAGSNWQQMYSFSNVA